MRRNRELQAKHTRQKSAAKPSAPRGKYGIMRDMKKNAKRALIFAVAIAGGLAAPLRSAASPDILRGGGCCICIYADGLHFSDDGGG